MKTAMRFQFWSAAWVTRTVLVIVAALLLFVVTASMIERPLPEPRSSQGTERKAAPGLPGHHRFAALA
jgi:hypothetical protein